MWFKRVHKAQALLVHSLSYFTFTVSSVLLEDSFQGRWSLWSMWKLVTWHFHIHLGRKFSQQPGYICNQWELPQSKPKEEYHKLSPGDHQQQESTLVRTEQSLQQDASLVSGSGHWTKVLLGWLRRLTLLKVNLKREANEDIWLADCLLRNVDDPCFLEVV